MARAAFMGTPAFAVPCLEALLEVADVPLVICQPDRRQGRGMGLTAPPVKQLAQARGVEVWQPTKVRDGSLATRLSALELDFALVVAYGRILPEPVLSAPRLGCLNVHASLLPRWRGAAPIQWAVIEGDAESGLCLMQMDEGMDTGPVLAQTATPIGADETAGQLSERLSVLSGHWLREQLPRFVRGELSPRPQPEEGITHARMLEKADGALHFRQPSQALAQRVRGLAPWPGAFVDLAQGGRLKVHVARALGEEAASPVGCVVAAGADGIDVACGRGVLRLLEVQAEGKRRMSARDYLAGHPVGVGQAWVLAGSGEDL